MGVSRSILKAASEVVFVPSLVMLPEFDSCRATTGPVPRRYAQQSRPHPPCADGEQDGVASDAAKAVIDPIRLVRMVKEMEWLPRFVHTADESASPT